MVVILKLASSPLEGFLKHQFLGSTLESLIQQVWDGSQGLEVLIISR